MSPFESDIGSANDCEILPFEAHQREVAEDAIRDLLKWIGEDTGREGLLGTPGRVVRAFEEYFSGYKVDPREYLKTVFTEINGYDDMVALTHIPFISHCEHHMAPIIGEAHVAYLPRNAAVGISKLARVVEGYARRLQIQERLTTQIGKAIEEVLAPEGVIVMVEATHHCISARGIGKTGSKLVSRYMTGRFRTDPSYRQLFELKIARQ
ncbi:GTP cyclohydrolase I FolE [Tepidicaulis sp.]|uniref:GTP cyclohydrolase I FolE n=1 Tax=Tepidicaulis sp. TaxID=1920809 RepID=UPI003B5BFE5F